MGKPKLHSVERESSDEDNGMYIATINSSSETKDWQVTIELNEQKTTFKIDTGAQCNVISKKKRTTE